MVREGGPACVDLAWEAVHTEYIRWRRDDILAIAEPYYSRDGSALPQPVYDSIDWLACLIYQRLSNLELVLSRKRSVKGSTPTEIFGVPVDVDVDTDCVAEAAEVSTVSV